MILQVELQTEIAINVRVSQSQEGVKVLKYYE